MDMQTKAFIGAVMVLGSSAIMMVTLSLVVDFIKRMKR